MRAGRLLQIGRSAFFEGIPQGDSDGPWRRYYRLIVRAVVERVRVRIDSELVGEIVDVNSPHPMGALEAQPRIDGGIPAHFRYGRRERRYDRALIVSTGCQ